MGKEEIARYEQFLLFPTMFSKAIFLLMLQNEYLWSKRLINDGIKKKTLFIDSKKDHYLTSLPSKESYGSNQTTSYAQCDADIFSPMYCR